MLDEKLQSELIARGRAFTHGYIENDPYEEDFQSDQELKRPQPPLVKAPMRGGECHNLYLACTGLGLGTCAIGAFYDPACNSLFELDGVEEYVVYTAPVGTIRECDTAKEAAFYAFVEEDGL